MEQSDDDDGDDDDNEEGKTRVPEAVRESPGKSNHHLATVFY